MRTNKITYDFALTFEKCHAGDFGRYLQSKNGLQNFGGPVENQTFNMLKNDPTTLFCVNATLYFVKGVTKDVL